MKRRTTRDSRIHCIPIIICMFVAFRLPILIWLTVEPSSHGIWERGLCESHFPLVLQRVNPTILRIHSLTAICFKPYYSFVYMYHRIAVQSVRTQRDASTDVRCELLRARDPVECILGNAVTVRRKMAEVHACQN